jgi:two-component system OmpR family response regulator
MRILLVEDDPILGMAVRDQLIDDGHTTDWVKRLEDAVDAIQAAAFELILLDLMLPDGRGLDFLKRLRSAGAVTPVMVLTALDQISGRIAALDVGADDYLIKPFDLFELSARIRAVGRRYCGNPNPLVSFGDFEVDLAARSIRRSGRLVQLTAREWSLFEAFVQRPNQLISKSQLEDRLYSFEAEIQSNTIEVYIGRLRKKLGAAAIETVRGMGYRLGSPRKRA